jgi:dipeptide/tripeptide permease
MMTNIENGGLQFSQESAMNIGGYFSFGILVFPLIMAPMIDKYLGYFKAAIYGGIAPGSTDLMMGKKVL